jgi:hypothetical protein
MRQIMVYILISFILFSQLYRTIKKRGGAAEGEGVNVPPRLRFATFLLKCSTLASLGCTTLSLALYPQIESAFFVSLSISSISLFLFISTRTLSRAATAMDPAQSDTKGVVIAILRSSLGAMKAAVRRTFRAAIPNNSSWREMRFPSADVQRPPNIFKLIGLYILLLLFAIGFSLLGAAISLGTLDGTSGDVVSSIFEYNTFFYVSILTITSFATISTVAVLRFLGTARFSIAFRSRVKTLAGSVGYGTLAGVAGAAISPITSMVTHSSDDEFTGPALPSLLLTLPGAGAILGYIVGLFVVVSSLADRSTNPLYQHFLTPLIFTFFTYVLYRVGFTPEFLLSRLVTQEFPPDAVSTAVCSRNLDDPELRRYTSDPRWFLALSSACGHSSIISGKVLSVSSSVLIWAVGIVRYLHSLSCSMRKIPKEIPKPSPGRALSSLFLHD